MRKIQCVYDRDNNFFFYLMSVAKVGYDNAYGESIITAWRLKISPFLRNMKKNLR